MSDGRAAIGFVGLGAMGSRMARRLVDAGHAVTVWNRTPAKAEALALAGATAAATPADAARAGEIVITMVTDPAALEAVTGGDEGVLAGLSAGSALVEMSTVGPEAIRALEPEVPAGVALVDAPVLGSIGEAEEGSLRIFAGGDEETVRRVEPVLSVLGSPVRVGPVGSGAAAKLVANSTLVDVVAALGEAIALGERLSLSREAIFTVLAATALGEQAERRRAAFEDRSYPSRFPLALARKDADLVTGTGADLRLGSAAASWLAEADDDGWGELDYSAILARIVGERKPGDSSA